nr:hypothetical protein [Gordonia sp. NB41Y]
MVRTGVDGVRAQVGMRLILAVFLVLVIACDPPEQFLAATWAVVGVYLGWTASTLLLARRPDLRVQEWAWAALFVDLAALTAVAVLAARSDATSWTSDVLLTGFALIPMAAATGLRPGVCVAIAVPTTVVFLAASAAARPANGEPVVVGAAAHPGDRRARRRQRRIVGDRAVAGADHRSVGP